MQDAPIHCPADVDATEVEQKACEAPQKPDKKPGDVTVQSGGGGTTNPPQPPKKN
ncbi:MAG: hypothetical protein PGN16_04135 [Sphingomonas phyllosphaerae]|uniref:hypothetical protein n=1 Tax=Sphingomonas phyllosphaerae TaxID=257003 RepID=UPI002FF8F863